MASVTLQASRPASIGVMAHRGDYSVSGDRILNGSSTHAGDEYDWPIALLDDAGLPIIGVVWEVARLAATDQRFSMYEGDSMSVLVQTRDIPLDGAEITYQIDLPGGNVTKRVSDGIVVHDPAPDEGEFEIILAPADTDGRAGVFRHQVRVVDAIGQASVVLDGHVTIRRRIREE